MKKLFIIFLLFTFLIYAKDCKIPESVKKFVVVSEAKHLKRYPDISRNYRNLNSLCVSMLKFKEANLGWRLFLVTNPNYNSGLFWFLPHDNENSAFDSAVYAVKSYGGGFLAVSNKDRRYNRGQDPNRNFSYSPYKLKSCKEQKYASPIYTSTIFSIIDYFKGANKPYLALHNNTNGGGVSILKESSKVKSYFAYPKSKINSDTALKDEDNLIYMAGLTNKAPSSINKILNSGINVKYERVNSINNDCSMSNFVLLEKGVDNYYNIEAQHHNTFIQKRMIDILLHNLYK